MTTKRADELRAGDVAKFGVGTGKVIGFIRESPRVLLIHTTDPTGRKYVYRKLANTIMTLIEEEKSK